MGNIFSFIIMRNDRKDGIEYGKNSIKRACEKNGMAELLEEEQGTVICSSVAFRILVF